MSRLKRPFLALRLRGAARLPRFAALRLPAAIERVRRGRRFAGRPLRVDLRLVARAMSFSHGPTTIGQRECVEPVPFLGLRDAVRGRTAAYSAAIQVDERRPRYPAMVSFTASTNCFSVNGFGKKGTCSPLGRLFSNASSA